MDERTKPWQQGEYVLVDERRMVYTVLDGELVVHMAGCAPVSVSDLVMSGHSIQGPASLRG